MDNWKQEFDDDFGEDPDGDSVLTREERRRVKYFIENLLSSQKQRMVDLIDEEIKPVTEEDVQNGWKEHYEGYNEALRYIKSQLQNL